MGIMPITGIPLPFMSYGGSRSSSRSPASASSPTSTCADSPNHGSLAAPSALRPARATGAAPTVAADQGHAGRPRCPTVDCAEMSNLWPRIEPLLARVEKPARYIGMERGSQQPVHRPGCGRLAARLPRHLRDRAAQPGAPDPLRDPERTPRRRRRARLRAVARPRGRAARHPGPALLGRHPPCRGRLRRHRVQPLGRARLHEPPELPRPRRRPGAGRGPRRRATRSSLAGGHCAFNPEPLADFVDAFVIGDGEEPVGEITEVVARWKRAGRPGGREARAARPRDDHGRLRAVDVRRRATTAPRSARSRRATPTSPRSSTSAPSRTSPTGRTRSSSWCPLIEVVHDRLNVEIFRGCTRGLPVLPGGDDHAPGPRAARRPGAHDGGERPAAHRLRRGRAHLALERRLLRDRQRSSATSSTSRAAAATSGSRCRRCGSTRSPSAIASQIQKVRRTGLDVRARGRLVADPPGDQQADHRGGPLRRGRRRVLAGLATGEALLPRRPAHRDGRGHARHRRAGARAW